MTAQTPLVVRPPRLTRAQRRALRALRTRYQQDQDLFSTLELAHLRFLRWLYQMGRLAP